MNFSTIALNQSTVAGQNCVTWILIALLFTLKLTLQVILKDGLIQLTMMKIIKDLIQQIKTKKIPGLFKDELGVENSERICCTYSKNVWIFNG